MHLQHSRSLEGVTVHRESRFRRLVLTATLCVLYGVSLYACVATSGKPYERALEQGRLLDVAGEQKLEDKAAQHAALQQRKKAEKLASKVADLRTDDEQAELDATKAEEEGAEDGGSAGLDDEKKKKKKKSEARRKAELALERAAKLAEAMVENAKSGENKTEEEVIAELFEEDEDLANLDDDDDAARPLPSKYLPDAWACLLLLSSATLHALFWLLCHWLVEFKAKTLYVASDAMNNKCHVLIVPQKHKGRPALVPVKTSKAAGGLVVEYQRQLYEFWGPEDGALDDDDDEKNNVKEDPWSSSKDAAALAAAAAAPQEEEEEEEIVEVVDDEDEEVVGLGRENGSLRRVSPPLRLAVAEYASSRGLSSREVGVNVERYGRNIVEVRVPSFLQLYKEQLLSPISMFQVFTSLLWLLDAYWQYVGFTLFSIVFMEVGTVVQRQRTLKSLSGMSAKAAPVFARRDDTWKLLASDELLPGDIISLSKSRGKKKTKEDQDKEEDEEQQDATEGASSALITKTKPKKKKEKQRRRQIGHVVPCDCLLVRGSAVANEATLTGESTPQMKDAVQDHDEERLLDMQGRDRVSVLFSGTELVHASSGDDPVEHRDQGGVVGSSSGVEGLLSPPDGGAVAVVLRTGFASAQGELMQMIEFSQQTVSSDTRETLAALFVLLIFALVSATYVFRRGMQKGDRTTHELLLRCVIIVTSVVPRQLPMQMALAVNTALMALMKNGIMATEPFRVPFAGRVKHCLFDKTGTLTTDRLSPVGVVSHDPDDLERNASQEARTDTDLIALASDLATVVVAGCHSLVAAEDDDDDDETENNNNNNKDPPAQTTTTALATRSQQQQQPKKRKLHRLVGDSIELTALRALGWDYDPKTAVAAPPSGLALPPPPSTKGNKSRRQKLKPKRVKILSRYHFSSALQRMAVVADIAFEGGLPRKAALVKGSPEAIEALLADGERPEWYAATYSGLAERGMRVLALSYKWLDSSMTAAQVDAMPRTDVETGLSFAGFVAFECKTRADSGVVCRALQDSAHRVAMLTGDAPLTALHVARATNIADPDAPALVLAKGTDVSGLPSWISPHTPPRCEPRPFEVGTVADLAEDHALVVTEAAMVEAASLAKEAASPTPLDDDDDDESELSDEAKAKRDEAEDAVWRACAASACVFARCSPQGKARVARSLQKLEGQACVLMCGDGGNDVGALKQADVGLALLAGYGDANTTTDEGGYADVGAKLAKGRAKVGDAAESSAEDVLNAQAEALADARERGAETRKKNLAVKQKELMARQKDWVEEELARRAEKGETGIGAQFGAVKAVAMRLRREMAREVDDIDRKLGTVYDNKTGGTLPEDAKDKASELAEQMFGEDAAAALPMIRPGDASVAAPFTSRAPSIRAVVDLVRQGRCTLLSSLQQQQIMCLESVISAYTLAALSLEGARSSERQMMASGWLLIIASMAFSYATPLEKMAPVRPLSSLFDLSIVASVAGQGAIHIFCMSRAVKLATERMGPAALDAVVKFQRRARAGEVASEEIDEDDITQWFSSIWSTPFLPNLLNTSVFLVETSQMVAVILVNYKGRPWMKGFLENSALFLSLFVAVAGLVLLAWGFVPEVNDLIHLAPFPDDAFRFQIVGLVAASLVGTLLWDRLCTALFAPHIFRAQLREARTTTLKDLAPVATTALKVAAGALLLAQGNILVLGGAAYFYRQYSQKQAAMEKERKAQLIQVADK